MRSVTFINRYFHPDHSATSQLLADLAFGLARAGWQVQVLASRQIYDDPTAELPNHQTTEGVEIHRLRTTRFGRLRLVGRMLDYLSFHLGVYRRLRSHPASGVIVAMTDPPLIGTTAALALGQPQAPLVLWNQDLFPEVALVQLLPRIWPIPRVLEGIRNVAVKRSACVVVLGEMMQERVEESLNRLSVGPPRTGRPVLEVIDNWALDESSIVTSGNLREHFGLTDQFVLGYSGNFGRVHDFEPILLAAKHLRNEGGIRFLMTGAGPRRPEVERFVEREQLDNLVFGPYQPRERLGAALATSDMHLISLARGYEGLVVPSKFYGICAAGRPSLYVGRSNGDVARLIERHECGIVVDPEDVTRLADRILELSNNPESVRTMGRNARRAWETNWTRARAIEQWNDLLAERISP